MHIISKTDTTSSLKEYIEKDYCYNKIMLLTSENSEANKYMQDITRVCQNNKFVSNFSEDVRLILCIGDNSLQQKSMALSQKHNIDYCLVILDLSWCMYLNNTIRVEDEFLKCKQAELIVFDKECIKEQNFESNQDIYSYLNSRYLTLLEKEFFSQMFNEKYDLTCKNKLIKVIESLKGLKDAKLENIQQANLIVLSSVIKYIKLTNKYTYLNEITSVDNFSAKLTNELFDDYYSNLFIASVFFSNLVEKYFALSFCGDYCFDYSNKLNNVSNEEFSNAINEYIQGSVTNKLTYKLRASKQYFQKEIFEIKTKYFLNKYDFLCIFDDFGYFLREKLINCKIKEALVDSSNMTNNTLIKQIRNIGLLDF